MEVLKTISLVLSFENPDLKEISDFRGVYFIHHFETTKLLSKSFIVEIRRFSATFQWLLLRLETVPKEIYFIGFGKCTRRLDRRDMKTDAADNNNINDFDN